MDLGQIQTENIIFDDPGWLGSRHGTDATRTIVLDMSLFTAGTHFPDGYLKSGCVLGRVTATGRYGPYKSDASNGQQTAIGFLYGTTRVHSPSATPAAALLHHGTVVPAKLSLGTGASATTPGALDAAGQTALTGRFFFIV